MDLLELFLGNFFGFGFALFLYAISQYYLDKKEKKKEKLMQNNFLTLIKNEIIFNKESMRKIPNIDFKKGETLVRLKTENKDGCWSKIMEYRHKNSELLDEISYLYYSFRAINYILDYEPFNIKTQYYLDKFCETRKKALKDVSKYCNEQIEKVIKLIDRELNKE